jgi:hypothetical protein
MSLFVSWNRAIYIRPKPSGKTWELTATARRLGERSGVEIFRGEDVVFDEFVQHVAQHHPIDVGAPPPADALFERTAFLVAAMHNNLYGFHLLRAELYDTRFLDAFERQYEKFHAIEMAALLAGLPSRDLEILEWDSREEHERGGDRVSEASEIRRHIEICRAADLIIRSP